MYAPEFDMPRHFRGKRKPELLDAKYIEESNISICPICNAECMDGEIGALRCMNCSQPLNNDLTLEGEENENDHP